MKNGWKYGAGMVASAHLLWLALIYTGAHSAWFMPAIVVMFFIVMNVAGLAAFVTALWVPHRRLWLALSMAPLSALLATASNLLLESAGTHVDFSGFRGNVGLFSVSLAYGIFVSAVGAGIAIWIRNRASPGVAAATVLDQAALPPSN